MLLITATFPSSIDMTWSLCPPDMNCSLGEGMIGWLRGVKRPSPMQGTSLMSPQMPERLSRGREKVVAAAAAAEEEEEEEEEEVLVVLVVLVVVVEGSTYSLAEVGVAGGLMAVWLVLVPWIPSRSLSPSRLERARNPTLHAWLRDSRWLMEACAPSRNTRR